MQLIHHRGLADAGIAGDQHELSGSVGHNTVEGGEQRVDLALPAVQFLRDHQPIRRVLRGKREWVDAAMRLPLRQALPQIGLNPGGGLIALLCILGQQLHYDCRELGWHRRNPLVGRCRLSGNVTVDPFQWISCGKRQHPGQHLVETDAERVQIATCIDGSIHPAGLFRSHVRQRAGDNLRRIRILALTRQAGRKAEACQPGAAADHVD